MAVGYLEQDWNAKYVRTQQRGKQFIFAVENFMRNSGVVVGIGFFFDPENAFVFESEETGDFLNAEDLLEVFTEEIVRGEESQLEVFEEEYECLIDEFGDEQEFFTDGLDLTEEELERARLFYNDIAVRYWSN